MTQYQRDEDYFEYEMEGEPAPNHKRKRLSNDFAPMQQHNVYQRHPAADIVAWAFVGLVGFALAVGSVIVAGNGGEEWVLIVPLVYMLGAMRMMRR